MSVRYQHGYLRCAKRKNGSACWEFMWREQQPSGKQVHRTAVIGAWYYNQSRTVSLVIPISNCLNSHLEKRIDGIVRKNGNQTEEELTPSAALQQLFRELQASLTELSNEPRVARKKTGKTVLS